MGKEDIGFYFVYSAFCVAGLGVALTYWYNEIFKKK
jgi:hypothetical protein